MKKVLSVLAVSAFVLTANAAFAGGPGKKSDGCPAACQQQIDDLNSSQAQQNEQLSAHGKQLQNHEGRIKTLETNAYNPWYARIGVRAAWMTQDTFGNNEWDSDMGWGAALAAGRQFGQFRAEIELAKQQTDLEDLNFPAINERDMGEVDVMTVMVNGYYEVPVADAFAVYAMAGVGYAKYDIDAQAINPATGVVFARGNASDNVFAYKAGAGVTYNFADNMAADLGYEYLGVADTNAADSINGHNIVASFRYKF